MLKFYIIQVWNLMRQEKLFSWIYIIGTALSITMVMVLAILLYLRVANVYPETNRDRMLIIKTAAVTEDTNGWVSSGSLSGQLIDECLRDLKQVEAVSVCMNNYVDERIARSPDGSKQYTVAPKYVDDKFWNVFSFEFTEGRPFGYEEFSSGIKTVVISESLARKVFGGPEVAGRYITLDFESFRISGVVRDVSYATPLTHGNVWIPYTAIKDYDSVFGSRRLLGDYQAYILVDNASDRKTVKQQVEENLRKLNSTFSGYSVSLMGQPDNYFESVFRFYSNIEPDFRSIRLKHLFVFLILLFVPAVSLLGMIDSRMERRMSECAVRRAFGARGSSIVQLVIIENLIFTLLGGFFGLILCYGVLYFNRDSVLELGLDGISGIPLDRTQSFFTVNMLVNIPVFCMALGICILLNLLSSAIPAWKASRKSIVNSIH